jgi:hypothetical protein
MPNPRVSLRHDQLILFSKAVNKKEQLEKMLEKEEEEKIFSPKNISNFYSVYV